ncbi:carboxypeptidase B-like [Anthonomus grandis grandis]|uniref:carboxypeptidase B-like n=1 Tax=Anthonomus grandis grandis TaxID=2921223 RepID=UPI00216699F4|nr:carboxypeptidase B-like [Anthonomus grandis grandis]
MMRNKILGYFLFLIGVINAESFLGYKVYQVTPQTQENAEFLQKLKYKPNYDFWVESRAFGSPSDIMVDPVEQETFEKELSQTGMPYKVVVDDVERLLQIDRVDRLMTRSRSIMGPGQVTFTSFMKYDEQMAYLRRIGRDYPQIATVTTAGHSYEGREILMVKISSGASQTVVPKPTIFIDAGIHSREWIAQPVALYLIQQLVENNTNAGMYQNVDWVIIPNLNPDGYEFTYNNNRMWRKNRRLEGNNLCYGTDLNRNFNYQWMFNGASNNSCTEIYAGPEPFSEPETRIIRDWFLNNTNANVKLYMAVHSFGEMVLFPWGYAPILPQDVATLRHVGSLMARAIEQASTMGSNYTVENSATLLGAAAGAADDWVKAVANVNLTYTLELPNGDAPFWFMIPARQILPVVRETFEGFRALHQYIQEQFWTSQQQS